MGQELPANVAADFALLMDERLPWDVRAAASTRFRAGLRAFEPELARACRAGGNSWAQIGKALGITRQAAQQRYGSEISG